MNDESPLTPLEIKRIRAQMSELERLKAQGKLVLGIGLAISGAVTWLWGDEVKTYLKNMIG